MTPGGGEKKNEAFYRMQKVVFIKCRKLREDKQRNMPVSICVHVLCGH
jgi:hypothetical protein